MKTGSCRRPELRHLSAIEAGFIVFCHTDLEPDIRDLPGFVPVAKYGQRSVINEYELGSVERFRFITSPELARLRGGRGGGRHHALRHHQRGRVPDHRLRRDGAFDVALRGSKSFDMSISAQPEGQVGHPRAAGIRRREVLQRRPGGQQRLDGGG
jgi:hypothetical protein